MDSLDLYAMAETWDDAAKEAQARARQFVEEHVRPVMTERHRSGAYLEDLFPAMGAAGLFGPFLEGYGLPGESHLAYGLMMMELERADSGLRSLASVQGPLAMHAIHRYGSESQKTQWLPRLGKGEAIASFALTERRHGSDPASMETNVVEKDGRLLLNGNKCWIGNASIADVLVIWAKGPDGKVGGYLVEKDAPGLKTADIEGKLSLKLSRTCEVWFENCEIPLENQLPEARGLKAPLSCLSQARFGIAWGVIGAALDCFHSTLAYAQGREQFNKPLASFQLVQDKFVWMASEITKAQLIATRLVELEKRGALKPAQISLAKRNNVWMALECARKCRDILGGIGITDNYPAMRHMLNLETVYTYEGTHDIHGLILGQEITGESAFA